MGYGESSALVDPFYNEEYQRGCWDMMRRYLDPMLLKAEIERPEDVHQPFLRVRRNFMGKSTVEAALWDATQNAWRPLVEGRGWYAPSC